MSMFFWFFLVFLLWENGGAKIFLAPERSVLSYATDQNDFYQEFLTTIYRFKILSVVHTFYRDASKSWLFVFIYISLSISLWWQYYCNNKKGFYYGFLTMTNSFEIGYRDTRGHSEIFEKIVSRTRQKPSLVSLHQISKLLGHC